MAIGALQAGYSELGYAHNKQKQMSVEDFYQGVSSAAECTEEENNTDVIGLTMIPYEYNGITYGMSARYAKESTEENPIVQVTSNYGGKEVSYKVAINEVNPESASELEMFALLSYADDKGMTDGGTYGSYQRLKVYTMNAEQSGYILPLSDYNGFLTGKRNWVDIIGKMGYDYEAAGVYGQSQNCKKLLWTFFAFYDEGKCTERLSEISSERHKTWDSGDMESYHKWTNIYNALNNYVLDKGGKTQYLETENGRFQAEVRVGELSSGILGLGGTLDGKSSYYARYADGSTKESPVIEVHITRENGSEDIRYIYVNTVNPENATELEMFAFLLHHEKQGTLGAGKSVYSQARQADFFDAGTQSDFTTVKINWRARLADYQNFEGKGALQELFEKVASEQTEREEAVDYRKLLAEKMEELYERIKNGEPEASYPIGAASFTEKEWAQLLKRFDAVQEAVREEQEARLEKARKKEQEKERDARRRTTEEI